MRAAALLLILASPAASDGYAAHNGVTLFTENLCSDVIALIDSDGPDAPDELGMVVDGLRSYVEDLSAHMAQKGMAWGFILGYDTAKGGLHTTDQTTLERLRETCDATPERTAMDILQSLD